MNARHFEEYSKGLLERCWNVLFSKSKEYASDVDRLANFKQPVSMMDSNPAEVCLWYDMKHVASLSKIVREIKDGQLPTQEMLEEKIGDYLNYGLLLYACIMEMLEEQKNKEQFMTIPVSG